MTTTISRRGFARFGLSGAAAMISVSPGAVWAQAAAGQATSQEMLDRLAPIHPELRPAARSIIEVMAQMPSFDAQSIRDPALANAMPQMPPLMEVPFSERTVLAQGSLPEVRVFVVNSDSERSRPAILHMHGGGFVLGSASAERRYLQETAAALDCVVVSVEYRLAPETTYLGSTEDNYAGLKWLFTHADELGVDRNRIAVMGESAGGGHAALLAIRARDRGEVPLVLQALVYPMLDDRTGSSRPVAAHIGTVGWDAKANRFGWESFLGMEPGGASVPAAAVPARTRDLSGLAPAFIGVGGVDLFVEEDIEYAQRLIAADVPAELLVIPGAFHGFDRVAYYTSLAQRFTQAKHDALRRAFAPRPGDAG